MIIEDNNPCVNYRNKDAGWTYAEYMLFVVTVFLVKRIAIGIINLNQKNIK